jgi:DNA polymerase-3 subunit epsilon
MIAGQGWRRALGRVSRAWQLHLLENKRYRFMFDPPPENEWVALDCETTGLDVTTDEIISIAAVRIVGNVIMTSDRLELLVRPERRRVSSASVRVHHLREQDVAAGMRTEEAVERLLNYIGSRPLVGYYLEFDLAMIERALIPLLGRDTGLPQARHEVSAMYYDYKFRQLPVHRRDDARIDLRFATLMDDLDLPSYKAHDALNDAMMAALAFVKLRHLLGR